MTHSFQLSDNKLSVEDFKFALKSDHNAWLTDFRVDAYSNFVRQAMPSRKIEHWKYNDVSFLKDINFQLSDNHVNKIKFDKSQQIFDDAITCVFIDGCYSAADSNNINELDIRITRFLDANNQQIDNISEILNLSKQERNSLVQLNNALSSDGIYIEIETNKKISKPIYLLYINSNQSDNQLSNNQVVINCGQSSESLIIEHFITSDKIDCSKSNLSLQQTIIHLEDQSHCEHYRLNLESKTCKQVSRCLSVLANHAKLNSFYYSNGSLLNKTDIDVYHQGVAAEAYLTGIYLPSDEQAIDYHTNVEHQVPHCQTRENFRGIVADASKATFNGKIHIFKDAQKSDAQLNNKNLLLTNRAEINTKPELEIYADDVVCAHGATIAKIDDKAIYYLQTRGIDKTRAKKMLSIGFINELLDQANNKVINQFLHQQVQACLSDIN